MNDIDAAEDWLDSWVAQVNTQAERSVELSRRVAALTGSVAADPEVPVETLLRRPVDIIGTPEAARHPQIPRRRS